MLVTASQQTDEDLSHAPLELSIDQIKAMLLVSEVVNTCLLPVRILCEGNDIVRMTDWSNTRLPWHAARMCTGLGRHARRTARVGWMQ